MTAAFGTAGAGTLTATSGAACTPAIPASTAAGDLLIAHVFYGGSTTAPDTPANWSLLDGPRNLSTPGTNGQVWVYGKKAVGSDAAPAFGTQAVTTPRRARVYRFTGVLNDTVANMVGAFNFETGISAAVSDVGVTTGADSSDYLACQLVAISENPTIGDFAGESGGNWTEAVAEFTGTTGTPDTCMQLQTAVVAPSTTINGGTVTPSTTNPWGVVGFYIRSAPPKDTAATLVAYVETAWNSAGTSKSAAAVSWLTGDLIVIEALVEDAAATVAVANQLGLTFAAGGGVGTSGATCWAASWSATATDDRTNVQVAATGDASRHWGIGVWVFRGSDGIGVRATDITTAKTVSLARSDAHSRVVGVQGDFSAASTSGYSFTPALGTDGHDRQHAQDSGLYSFYVADWDDQGSAGTTSYGTSGETSSGTFAKLVLEILGTVGGGPTAVGKDLGLVWDTRAALGDTIQAVWNVRTFIGDTVQAVWDVRAAAGDTVQAVWNVRAALGDTVQLVWNVETLATAVGKDLGLVWNVRAALGDTIQAVWNVRAALGDTVQAVWDVRSALGDTVQLVWNVEIVGAAAVGKDLGLVWNTRAALGDTVQAIWDVRAALGDTVELVWGVRTFIGDTVQAVWAVRTLAGDTVALVWNVRAAASDPLGLVWNVESLFVPAQPPAGRDTITARPGGYTLEAIAPASSRLTARQSETLEAIGERANGP